MAEKSSLIENKLSFKGKNRVLSFLVKSSFPQNAQKSLHFAKLQLLLTAFSLLYSSKCLDVSGAYLRRKSPTVLT